MGEIRFVGTGETRGYPYPVCKKKIYYNVKSDSFSNLCKSQLGLKELASELGPMFAYLFQQSVDTG